MASSDLKSTPDVALLSAASVTSEAGYAENGDPFLLQYQIGSLARAGINRFLVEVDNVTGALLQLADKSRAKGRSVEFVRTGADARRLLQPEDRLWIQSEAHYVAPSLLDDLIKNGAPFVATLDGRNENGAFERIDLNTRWAGVALVDAGTAGALHDLPEGWSMTSSLLRQALQDKVAFRVLQQQHVQAGNLRIIRSAQDIAALNREILNGRIDRYGGFIETRILRPVAIRVAPVIARKSFGPPLVGGAGVLSAAISVWLGILGWDVAAVAFALAAIALNILAAVVADPDDHSLIARGVAAATWMLLGLSVLATARADMSYSSDGIYAAMMLVGLALLVQKIVLPDWAGYVLKSPALLAVLALIVIPVGGFTQAIQWIGVGQLGVAIAARWQAQTRGKKAGQA